MRALLRNLVIVVGLPALVPEKLHVDEGPISCWDENQGFDWPHCCNSRQDFLRWFDSEHHAGDAVYSDTIAGDPGCWDDSHTYRSCCTLDVAGYVISHPGYLKYNTILKDNQHHLHLKHTFGLSTTHDCRCCATIMNPIELVISC